MLRLLLLILQLIIHTTVFMQNCLFSVAFHSAVYTFISSCIFKALLDGQLTFQLNYQNYPCCTIL